MITGFTAVLHDSCVKW